MSNVPQPPRKKFRRCEIGMLRAINTFLGGAGKKVNVGAAEVVDVVPSESDPTKSDCYITLSYKCHGKTYDMLHKVRNVDYPSEERAILEAVFTGIDGDLVGITDLLRSVAGPFEDFLGNEGITPADMLHAYRATNRMAADADASLPTELRVVLLNRESTSLCDMYTTVELGMDAPLSRIFSK